MPDMDFPNGVRVVVVTPEIERLLPGHTTGIVVGHAILAGGTFCAIVSMDMAHGLRADTQFAFDRLCVPVKHLRPL